MRIVDAEKTGLVQAIDLANSEAPALPESTQASIDMVALIDKTTETATSISNWMIGRILRHMRDTLEVEDPRGVVQRAVGIGERFLEYCMTVHSAYTWEEIRHLALDLGVRWSLVRELAGPKLASHRDHLVGLLEAGDITQQELMDQVAKLRSDIVAGAGSDEVTDGTSKADIEMRFKGMAAKIKSAATKLHKLLDGAAEEFKGRGAGLADALVLDADGGRNEAMESCAAEMVAALGDMIVVAADVVYHADLQLFVSHWPFDALDEALADYHEAYDDDGKLRED